MKNLLGVIMCGGESKRMGNDKGLTPIHDSIWALFMAGKLSFLEVPVVFSININQLKSYSNFIAPDNLIVDDHSLEGPARGILTVHSRFPGNDILLLACDMLDLDDDTIQNVLQAYQHEDTYDFYVYQDDEYAQPFCGIYTSRGLDKLQEEVRDRFLTNISMQYVLNQGITKRLAIERKKAFTNFNFRV